MIQNILNDLAGLRNGSTNKNLARQIMQPEEQTLSHRLTIYLNNQNTIIGVCVIAFIGYITLLTDNLFSGGDNARYLILAQSLVSGRGYRNIGLLSEPTHGIAPPGFAFLLTFIIRPFGINIILSKILIASWGALSILLVYVLMKRKTTSNQALLVAILYAITPVIFMYSRRVYSDLPFMVFALLVLICVPQYTKTMSKINRWWFFSIICLIISFYIRPVGLVLLFVSGIWVGLIKREVMKSIYLCLPVIVAIFPWYYWVSLNVESSPTGHFSAFASLDNLGATILLLLKNLYQYLTIFSENIWYLPTKGLTHLGLTTGIFSILVQFCVLIISLIMFIGFLQSVKKNFYITDLFVIIYLFILLPYTFVIDRFIIPLVPFVIFYFIQGSYYISDKIETHFAQNQKWPSYLPSLAIFIVIFSSFLHIGARIYEEKNFKVFHPAQAGLVELASWAKENIESSAIVLTDKPDFFYIYAERQTVDYNQQNPYILNNELVYITAEKESLPDLDQWFQNDESIRAITCSQISNLCLYAVSATIP